MTSPVTVELQEPAADIAKIEPERVVGEEKEACQEVIFGLHLKCAACRASQIAHI